MAKKNTQAAEVTTEVVTTDVVTQDAPQTLGVDMQALNQKHAGVKSKMIRELAAGGMSTAAITKAMQTIFPKFIYQHARNVLNTKVKKVEG